MKIVSIIFIVVLVGGLSFLCVWQGIKLIKDIKAYRLKKKNKKTNDTKGD